MQTEPEPFSFWDQITRVVGVFATSEVKTPLSFAFRMSLYLVIVLGLILFSSIADDFKRLAVVFFSAFLFLLFVFVVVFAWFRPKNLVYGEAGYRSEKRLEFGTNRRIRNVKEIEAEKGIEDKGLLPPPDEIEVKH
jgi:hypothetical protein